MLNRDSISHHSQVKSYSCPGCGIGQKNPLVLIVLFSCWSLFTGALRNPPVLRDPVSDREFTHADLDKMADYLEQVFTDIPLKAEDDEANTVASGLYSAFNK